MPIFNHRQITTQICKDCTSKLLKSLYAWGVKGGDKSE